MNFIEFNFCYMELFFQSSVYFLVLHFLLISGFLKTKVLTKRKQTLFYFINVCKQMQLFPNVKLFLSHEQLGAMSCR